VWTDHWFDAVELSKSFAKAWSDFWMVPRVEKVTNHTLWNLSPATLIPQKALH